MNTELFIELLFGGVFVLVHAVTRFNTPETNRSSTTALCYYSAVLFYVLIIGILYYLLATMPQLLKFVSWVPSGETPSLPQNLSFPLLAALLWTVLLPKNPLLAGIDAWLRKRLQDMASIPGEVRRLSAELLNSTFEVSAMNRETTKTTLLRKGFQEKDVVFSKNDAPQYLWTKITVLMKQLETWESDRKFVSFMTSSSQDLKALRDQYEVLSDKAKICFDLQHTSDTGIHDAKTRRAITECKAYFIEQVSDVLRNLCVFISRGVLHTHVTYAVRCNQLEAMGFARIREALPTGITLNQAVYVFFVVGFIFVIGLPIIGRGHVTAQMPFSKSIMIAAIYGTAILCVLYSKSKWEWARIDSNGWRPWSYYLLVGFLAAVAGGLISLVYRFILLEELDQVWKDFLEKLPWMLMTFITAVMTAFHTDNVGFEGWKYHSWLRWIEGASQAGATIVVGQLVHGMLVTKPPFMLVLVISGCIGFAIGSTVPTWYRKATQNSSASRNSWSQKLASPPNPLPQSS